MNDIDDGQAADHQNPARPDLPSALRLRLDRRIHRQRLALRENWQIVDSRRWARQVRMDNRHLHVALRLLCENEELKRRLADPEALVAGLDHEGLVETILHASARLSSECTTEEISTAAMKAEGPADPPHLDALLAIASERQPVRRVIAPQDVLWEMDWSERDDDGTRKYPDKLEKEEVFEAGPALATLLINETVYVSGNDGLRLGVDCSDVFAWGCADLESATHADLEDVYRHWLKDPRWGAAIWCMIRRRQMPQRPVERHIREAGIWDLDALRIEHGLLPNQYDGVSGVLARRKYKAYAAWERSEARDPLPFDPEWWAGWRRFVAAHPGWYDDAWKAEDDQRVVGWRLASGYDTDGRIPSP